MRDATILHCSVRSDGPGSIRTRLKNKYQELSLATIPIDFEREVIARHSLRANSPCSFRVHEGLPRAE